MKHCEKAKRTERKQNIWVPYFFLLFSFLLITMNVLCSSSRTIIFFFFPHLFQTKRRGDLPLVGDGVGTMVAGAVNSVQVSSLAKQHE